MFDLLFASLGPVASLVVVLVLLGVFCLAPLLHAAHLMVSTEEAQRSLARLRASMQRVITRGWFLTAGSRA